MRFSGPSNKPLLFALASQHTRCYRIKPPPDNIPLHALMMMAPEYYVFTGERVPDHITHVLIHKALNFVPTRAFYEHPNIQEVICHDGVEKIEGWTFSVCPSLRRVIMPGVKVVAQCAFYFCKALTYIECGKLEDIGDDAFSNCESLNSVDLPSIKIVGGGAFQGCRSLVNAKFGKELGSIKGNAFAYCRSLERIALPLKDGIISVDNTFTLCVKLNRVDLVEAELHETIGALLMEGWKSDMNEEIDAISRILPSTHAGDYRNDPLFYHAGEKAREIRTWMRSVLRKYTQYKAEHRRYLSMATATLQSSLPNDVVLKNVLPFLELPSYACEADDDDSEDDNIPLAALRLA